MKAGKLIQVIMPATMLCCLCVFAACGNQQQTGAVTDAQTVELSMVTDTVHTSSNSVDYAGTYNGITPCADCEGIETVLTLNNDSTFSLSLKYQGKGDGKPMDKTGRFVWIDGGTIQLEGITDGPSKFKVGEGRIWQLDMQGNKIEGQLAEKYILTKIN